jgi:hypothetical protein
MKYKVVKGCVIKGSIHQPGEVVELDKDLAKQLMGIGRVMPHDEVEAENRSVGLDCSSEEPAKRRGRPKKVEEPAEEAPEE